VTQHLFWSARLFTHGDAVHFLVTLRIFVPGHFTILLHVATVGVVAATQAEPDHLGVVAEIAAHVAPLDPGATQVKLTVDHLGVVAEIAAHVVSLDPGATQVELTVDHLGVVAEIAVQLASLVPGVDAVTVFPPLV